MAPHSTLTDSAQASSAETVAVFERWRAGIVAASQFQCEPIEFAASREWRFDHGILRHRTGGFFSLAGLEVSSRRPELDGQQQLAILQPETAINGFLVRMRDGRCQVLFQGRVEPGNIGALQLAPTVQSTEANYKRMHGGGATPFLEWFTGERESTVVYDELQSEEATRYYGKYNRNVVCDIGDADPELPDTFRWYDLDALRAFAVTSNILNTDARSVLSGLDWSVLAGDAKPFAHHAPGSFGAALAASFAAEREDDDCSDAELLAWLLRLRVACSPRHRVLPIHELDNWVVEDGVIRERQREQGFRARQFRVTAVGREVRGWDQPLIDSDGCGRLSLVAQERGGVMRLLIRASHEIGFLEGVQCAPSITIVPGGQPADDPVERELAARIDSGEGAELLLGCRQSEEGGRFYHDENDYEIALLAPDVQLPESAHYRWATLAQIRRLIGVPSVFSMEFRGTLALLLHYV